MSYCQKVRGSLVLTHPVSSFSFQSTTYSQTFFFSFCISVNLNCVQADNISKPQFVITELVQEKTLKLIATAYTSVRPEDVSVLLGVEVPQVEEIIINKGWTVSEGLIIPVEPISEEALISPSEDQIGKLTEFVSFLEN